MEQLTKNIRRLVTGHSKDGKSIVVSDTTVDNIDLGAGKRFIQIWGDDEVPVHPDNGIMNEDISWFPKPGGHRFFVWVVPPKSINTGQPKSKEEVNQLVPGFLDCFEPDNPGMHTTDTVDCTYLISGAIVLELDDQQEIALKAGDSIVQNGTRHKWHNRSDIPAVFITTCIGSERKLQE